MLATVLVTAALALAGNAFATPGIAQYHGGFIQRTPHVFLIFWGEDWNYNTNDEAANSRGHVEELFRWMPTSEWYGTLTQYFDTAGYISHEVPVSSYVDPNEAHPDPREVSESTLFEQITYSTSHNSGWPTPGPEDQYDILTPRGTTYELGFPILCAGHLWDQALGTSASVITWPETDEGATHKNCINYEGFEKKQETEPKPWWILQSSASHEFAEAVTDTRGPASSSPDPGSYNGSAEYEIADVCEGNKAEEAKGIHVNRLHDDYLAAKTGEECPERDAAPVRFEAQALAASSVTPHAAVLNGSINPAGYSASYKFHLLHAGNLIKTIPEQAESVGKGFEAVKPSKEVSKLEPNTTYTVRLVPTSELLASSGYYDAEFYTNEASFTTPPAPPEVVTEGATGEKGRMATLKGKVNPEGADTHYWFVWGTSKEHLTNETSHIDIGDGDTPIAASQQIERVSGRTHYYYRLIAENSVARVEGNGPNEFETPRYAPVLGKSFGGRVWESCPLVRYCQSGRLFDDLLF